MTYHPIRVLVVDDDEDDYVLTRDLLSDIERACFQVEWAATYDAALEAIAKSQHDVYLLDYRLGDRNGLELLRAAVASGCTSVLILLTAQGDHEIDVEAMKAGAADYLDKGQLNGPLLERSIRYAIERKQSQKSLVQSEERFRTLVNSIEDLVFTLDGEQRYTEFFGRWSERAKIEPDCFLGKTAREALGEEAGVIHEAAYNQTLSGQAVVYEWSWESARGTEYFQTSLSPIRNATAGVTGIVGVGRNITERKQAEEKIREQAALLDVATDAIMVQCLNNKILFWNKSAQHLYGWQVQEALGKNTTELYKQPIPLLKDAHKTVALKGEWQGELHQVTKSGKEIIVESRWTLVRDDENKPKSILVVNTDITEKKQLQTQFLRAQRMESLGTLASGIAHDLNNVLAPMLMSAQLLQMKITDDRTQLLLKTLEGNVKRGAALVKQVLSFARGLEGDRSLLQIADLILETKQIATETFPKSIQISTDIAPNLWSISGDATQLHQVLMNLAVNARDAMPNGGKMTVSAENIVIDQHYARMNIEAKVGSYIAITVSDTGTGIPPEIVDRIFEPFFTTKELGKGTGLGLSIVIGIIKGHGGFVNVGSKVGWGTQFQVYLPATPKTKTLPVQSRPEVLAGKGELILVVDDEVAIREVTKTSLETYAYKVLTACDGIEAIALYAQHQHEISIVLVDMMMPSMDGSTTIRTLQQINPQIKIIAVSGLLSSDNVSEAFSVKAFLSKPYTAQELLKTINEVKKLKSQKQKTKKK